MKLKFICKGNIAESQPLFTSWLSLYKFVVFTELNEMLEKDQSEVIVVEATEMLLKQKITIVSCFMVF